MLQSPRLVELQLERKIFQCSQDVDIREKKAAMWDFIFYLFFHVSLSFAKTLRTTENSTFTKGNYIYKIFVVAAAEPVFQLPQSLERSF